MKKLGIIKNFTEMDRRKIQMEMVAERMNDDFSRHLSAAIGCLVRETVKELSLNWKSSVWQRKEKIRHPRSIRSSRSI